MEAWKNTIMFGADMSSSVNIDNENKDILILSEETTQGLDDTTLTAEAKYPINLTIRKSPWWLPHPLPPLPKLKLIETY